MRAGTPTPGRALPPCCPTISRASAHTPHLRCQPGQLHLPPPSFQSQPPSVSGRKAGRDGHVPRTEGAPEVQRRRAQEPHPPPL